MLALTGSKANGWLPSIGHAEPEDLAAMNAAIDESAVQNGRRPADIRRLYNINGRFGNGTGFLQGSPSDWAQQLAELTLAEGISTYILSVSSDAEVRRFADEVAPAVRQPVETERGRVDATVGTGSELSRAPDRRPGGDVASGDGPRSASASVLRGNAVPLAVTPTPDDGRRLAKRAVWDERSRPNGPEQRPGRRYTADQQAAAQHLVDIHDGLRGELEQLRDLIEQVARGQLDAGDARSFINKMTIRQNDWTLGAYCAQYCRIVTGHHTLEDRSVFPHLKRSDPELVPVIDRLEQEHHVIADVLDQVDRALVALVSESDGMTKLRGAVDLLTDTLLSHVCSEIPVRRRPPPRAVGVGG